MQFAKIASPPRSPENDPLKGLLPNSALKGKAKSLTKLPVDNFAFSFNLPLFLIF